MTAAIDIDADLAIVGGGASGVLLALRALARLPGLRIAIVEPQARLGAGAAYATRHPEHLLNVPAGRMSADEREPDDFVEYLATRDAVPGDGPLRERFVPRFLFHDYLAARLGAAAGRARIEHVRDAAVGCGGRTGTVVLASGARVRAGALVLATGNQARGLPVAVPPDLSGRLCDAWDYEAVRGLPREAEVAIVGTGLSMVDAVLSLHARGHRGGIVAVSRHALLPLPHAAPGESMVDVQHLLGLPLRARLRRLRELAADAGHRGEPWQWVMQALRPHGPALWRSLPEAERGRFLRHLARYWDVHRHRIAPQAAAVLQALLDSGQLTVAPARLQAVEAAGARLRLRAESLAWDVDRIVNATGIELRLARTGNPLLASLRDAGRVRAGPFGLGLDADPDGALHDAQGRTHGNLFALGSLRLGTEWESVAVPELRVQAARIADRLDV